MVAKLDAAIECVMAAVAARPKDEAAVRASVAALRPEVAALQAAHRKRGMPGGGGEIATWIL